MITMTILSFHLTCTVLKIPALRYSLPDEWEIVTAHAITSIKYRANILCMKNLVNIAMYLVYSKC